MQKITVKFVFFFWRPNLRGGGGGPADWAKCPTFSENKIWRQPLCVCYETCCCINIHSYWWDPKLWRHAGKIQAIAGSHLNISVEMQSSPVESIYLLAMRWWWWGAIQFSCHALPLALVMQCNAMKSIFLQCNRAMAVVVRCSLFVLGHFEPFSNSHSLLQSATCFNLFANILFDETFRRKSKSRSAGVHKSFQPTSRAGSTWSKFGARGKHGERGEDGKHGDVLRFSTEVFSGSPT